MQGSRQDGYGGVPWVFARLYLALYSQHQYTWHGIMIISWEERKLDRLQMNPRVVLRVALFGHWF